MIEVTPHRGEWVKPGDTVMKVVNMEKLKVEGFVNMNKFNRDQLKRRTVKVEVQLKNQRVVSTQGKIVFVNPVTEAGGDFRIEAEIQNIKNPQMGSWEFSPGMNADIVLGQ